MCTYVRRYISQDLYGEALHTEMRILTRKWYIKLVAS